MEFKDLPSDVQKTAAHTLHSVLREIGKDIASEPAKRSGPENQDRFR
ncbi:hypothetical protein O5621_27020 [Escherichia coli]|nr:hypothetical protein [Escherichia coli]